MPARAPRMPAPTTSAWSSSATACSGWSSPSSSTRQFPEASEGELSLRLNAMVNAETLAGISEEIGLPDLINAGSEMRSLDGRKRVNLRADALESLIAAIYLEGGLDAARNFILRHWSARSSAIGAGAPRPQDRVAGMGASGRRRRAGLHDRRPRRARPRPALHRQREARRLRAGDRQRPHQAAGRDRRRQRRSFSAKASGNRKQAHERDGRTGTADDAFGLRRADRRAQCRQVDAGQPAGRHQGVDRHPQGADDARHHPRHRHARQRADRAARHARHLQAAPARSTAPW